MATAIEAAEPLSCWCCGTPNEEESLVRLGSHPEVTICLQCAHFLELKAKERHDEQNPSAAARARDVARFARSKVIEKGWHRRPGVGRVLRWIGRHTP